jgi:cytochrome c oxidase assembly protein subunit 11
VRNVGELPITGQATYNVTPLRAAKYFHKIKCFCENGQKLGPQQSARFGVSYYVNPKIATDPDTKDIKTVTLSYTFFPAKIETKTVAQLRAVN